MWGELCDGNWYVRVGGSKRASCECGVKLVFDMC